VFLVLCSRSGNNICTVNTLSHLEEARSVLAIPKCFSGTHSHLEEARSVIAIPKCLSVTWMRRGHRRSITPTCFSVTLDHLEEVRSITAIPKCGFTAEGQSLVPLCLNALRVADSLLSLHDNGWARLGQLRALCTFRTRGQAAVRRAHLHVARPTPATALSFSTKQVQHPTNSNDCGSDPP